MSTQWPLKIPAALTQRLRDSLRYNYQHSILGKPDGRQRLSIMIRVSSLPRGDRHVVLLLRVTHRIGKRRVHISIPISVHDAICINMTPAPRSGRKGAINMALVRWCCVSKTSGGTPWASLRTRLEGPHEDLWCIDPSGTYGNGQRMFMSPQSYVVLASIGQYCGIQSIRLRTEQRSVAMRPL